jgi:hypothetical protein
LARRSRRCADRPKKANAEAVAAFTVKPPEQDSEGTLRAIASIDGREYSFERVRISYPHIGVHTLMPRAEVKVVRADIQKKGERLGYIPGAGDDVPESLQQIGYTVKMLSDGDITAKNLAQFSAVVLGIRAYNTDDRISTWLPELICVRTKWGCRNRPVQHHGRSQNQGNGAVSIGNFARPRY